MSEGRLRLSRRRMLQLSGMAPIAAMAAAGASDEQLAEEAMRLAGIPTGVMNELTDKADAYQKMHGRSLNTTRFKRVAATMWSYFLAGAKREDLSNTRQLLLAAYAMPTRDGNESGNQISDNLDKWSSNDHEPTTNACAFRCGYHARKAAGNGEVTVPMFETAWKTTRDEAAEMFDRLDRMKKSGEKPGPRGGAC